MSFEAKNWQCTVNCSFDSTMHWVSKLLQTSRFASFGLCRVAGGLSYLLASVVPWDGYDIVRMLRGTYSTYSTCTYRRLGFSDCLKPQLSIGTISRVQWKSTRDLLSFRFDNGTHWATQPCRWQSTPCQEIEFEWFWNIEAVRCRQNIAPSMISTLLEEDPEITFNAAPAFFAEAQQR